jgi:hypothetical protein
LRKWQFCSAAADLGRVTGNPEVISSPVGLLPINALLVRKIEDRIMLFAAALEAASDGEEQTQTSPEDGP